MCHAFAMRLVASAPLPLVALGALSLAAGIGMASQTIEAIPVTVEIPFSPEPIDIPDQQYVQHAHSVWEGTYVCAQGLASVKLTIDVDSLGVAMARYDFGPVPSNPVIPKTGAFLLVGTMIHATDGSFTGELDARTWIERPDDYFMVPLSIASDDGVHMRGTINHNSCSDFQAIRTR